MGWFLELVRCEIHVSEAVFFLLSSLDHCATHKHVNRVKNFSLNIFLEGKNQSFSLIQLSEYMKMHQLEFNLIAKEA